MLCGHPHDMHQLIIIHEFVPILFLKFTSISFRANGGSKCRVSRSWFWARSMRSFCSELVWWEHFVSVGGPRRDIGHFRCCERSHCMNEWRVCERLR